MSYLPGQRVKIKLPHQDEVEGTIAYLADYGLGYWVNYKKYGKDDCDVFSCDQLDTWNVDGRTCVCGAESVGSDRHSTWCDKHEISNFNFGNFTFD